MQQRPDTKAEHKPGFMSRLGCDQRGATLAIMCAALVPLAGMVGGGIDVARMYITKTRLQHACDAGALAGRKQMGSGTWASDDVAAAERFFDANYQSGVYGTQDRKRSFAETGGKVTGSASAVVPMTLMRVFGKPSQTLSVTCDAEMRLPNTDIMFVLDNTGSMNDTPSGDSMSKLASLKVAVKCFYEIVARLDTDATCTTGAPSGGTGDQVQIRFGFVPYATNVNVGRLLKPEWMADSWTYQSRAGRWWVMTSSSIQTDNQSYSTSQADCNVDTAKKYGLVSSSDDRSDYKYYPNGTTRNTSNSDVKNISYDKNSGKCSGTLVATKKTFELRENVVPTANDDWWDWHYGPIGQRVGGLKNGTDWNAGTTANIGSKGAAANLNWDGCIEERRTTRASSYDPRPNDARDLDLDAVPTAGDKDSLWGPLLPGMIYTRTDSSGNRTMDESYTRSDMGNSSSYGCPLAAQKLRNWPDASEFSSYVDKMRAGPNTYHDIGLIWGGRLMSPGDANGNGGLFGSDNRYTPKGGEIDRHLIFMTDGDTCTGIMNYQAYGVAWYDRRETDQNTVPSDGCTTTGSLTQQVNARTTAVCNFIKNKNITLWVITFGSVANSTVTRLKACATSGRYFSASNAAQLQQTFAQIANQISQLRLTQ